MGVKEDIMAVKEQINDIKNESFAFNLISDYKLQNKRQFIIIIIILIMWFATIGYLIYTLNDIGTVETTQEITDVDKIENSNITNGDVYGEN